MIKKLNDELDHLPFIIKIIVGLVMVFLITMMSFLFVGVVHAQTTNVTMTNYTLYTTNSGTYISGNNGESKTPGLPVYRIDTGWNQVNGSINGTIYLTIENTNLTINDIKLRLYNGVNLNQNATMNKSCTQTSGTFGKNINCQITFQAVTYSATAVTPTIWFDSNTTALTKFTLSGSATIEDQTPASTYDITNQTIQIINNAVEIARQQAEQAVENTNTIGNRVESIINSATNAIQTTFNHLGMSCKDYSSSDITVDHHYFNSNGELVNGGDDSPWGITDYIYIKNGELKVLQTYDLATSTTGIFYDASKTKISTFPTTSTSSITIPTNATYVRFTINRNNGRPVYEVCIPNTDAIIENQNQNTDRMIDKMILFHEADEEDWEEEKGLLQSILSAIGNIFSSSIDDPSNTLNGFNNSIATNNTVSSLLLLPVRLYQNVLNNINGSCNSFTLGSLYNHNLTMTCIQPQSFLGSALYGVIDVIISGFFILHIRKKFVDIFNHLTSLRTGGNELE